MSTRSPVRMAIAYDFDGTLCPGNMQEHQFLPDLGVNAADFWAEVYELARDQQADVVLCYMSLMLQKASAAGTRVRRPDFHAWGANLPLFPGVQEWFGRVSVYGRARGLKLDHYLISSGNAELIAGTPIASSFAKIYASTFLFDEKGVARWPGLAINYTSKTQYLFRINKGAHDLSDNSAVNRYIEKQRRPVPFERMIYIGDGMTDLPCFRLVKAEGGLSIGVFDPSVANSRQSVDGYHREGRIDAVVPAIYTPGSPLDRLVTARIDQVASALTAG